MILSSREADPQIRHALISGELISADVAQTIAAGLHSPAARDEQLTRLSHGKVFEPSGLLARVGELISGEFSGTDVLPELHALRAWALARVPYVETVTYRLSGDEWQAWSQEWGQSDRSRPDGIERYADRDVTLVASVADDVGGWVYPGDADYPTDPHAAGLEVDESDGGVWLPAGLVDAAAAMLAGTRTRFWAQSYGANPFGPGDGWGDAGGWDDLGPGKEYASRYEDPYGRDVRITLARLVGFTPDQEEQVYRAWR